VRWSRHSGKPAMFPPWANDAWRNYQGLKGVPGPDDIRLIPAKRLRFSARQELRRRLLHPSVTERGDGYAAAGDEWGCGDANLGLCELRGFQSLDDLRREQGLGPAQTGVGITRNRGTDCRCRARPLPQALVGKDFGCPRRFEVARFGVGATRLWNVALWRGALRRPRPSPICFAIVDRRSL
jgi:hypothetical protein